MPSSAILHPLSSIFYPLSSLLQLPLRSTQLARFEEPHPYRQRESRVGNGVQRRQSRIAPQLAERHRAPLIGELCPLQRDPAVHRAGAVVEDLQVRKDQT